MSSLSYKSPLLRQLSGFVFLAIATALFIIWRGSPQSIFLIAAILMTVIAIYKALTIEETILKEGEAKAKKRTLYAGFYKVEEQCEFDTVDMMCNDHMLGRWQVYVTQSEEMMNKNFSAKQLQDIEEKRKKHPGFVVVEGLSRSKALQAIEDIKQHCSLKIAKQETPKQALKHLKHLPHHDNWDLKTQNAHPNAVKLLEDEFYWGFLNENAPLANDTAVDILTDYSEAFEKTPDLNDFSFLQTCFQAINKKRQKIKTPNDEIRAEFALESDQTCIALCFSSFLLKGDIHPQVKALALQSIENQTTEENFKQNQDIAQKVEAMPSQQIT